MADAPPRAAGKAAALKHDLPSDAVAIRSILKGMGVTQYEPRVLDLLLNFMYKYTSEVILDAEAFGQQAGRQPGEVEAEDVTAAIQCRSAHYFVAQPPQAVQEEIAKKLNAQPLPDLARTHGIRLPPEQFCLTRPCWQIQLSDDEADFQDTDDMQS